MTRIVPLLFLLLLTAGQAEARPPRITLIVDGPSFATEAQVRRLSTELNTLYRDRYPDYRAPATPSAVGDFTLKTAERLVSEALRDGSDLVIGLGFQVGKAVAKFERLPKPVVLPFAEPIHQGLPHTDGRSDRRNLAYLTGLIDLRRELIRFRDTVRCDQATVVLDAFILDGKRNIEHIVQQEAGSTLKATLLPVDSSNAKSILNAIPVDAVAVYLGPLSRLPASEVQPLIDGLNARKLPSYASQGYDWVQKGAFTTLVGRDEEQRRLRRTALYVQDIYAGTPAESLSTAFERHTELYINMATARVIGVWPSFDLMTEAYLVGKQSGDRGPILTLQDAARLATDHNLTLTAQRQENAVAASRYDEAIGVFLPTLTASAQGTLLDPSLANPLGNAERQLGYGVNATQLLYAPGAERGIRAARANRTAIEAQVRGNELDVILNATTTYLNVMRARNAERINQENLRRVRRNLSLAELRVEVGSAGRQEVYRWQNEIANSRAAVISASATRNQAEIALNRTLNRPLETAFQTEEPMGSPTGIVLDDRVGAFVNDPWSFKLFRSFMADEAKKRAPEITQLTNAITTQRHFVAAQRQELYLPTLSLSGGINHVPLRGGAGSEDIDTSGLPFPARDDFTWQAMAGLSFTVFDGARYPKLRQAEATLTQLRRQKDAVAQSVELRVRSAMHQASSSYAAVKLRHEAAEASSRNLDLVRDAYRTGTVSIITFVDAQNQALNANLGASNAVYDFLIDYLQVERAVGAFGFLWDEATHEDFVRRLQSYARSKKEEQ